MEKLAIVIVTYKRQQLLDQLLDSLLYLQDAPWRVIVVDNENSPEAANVVELHRRLVDEGLTAVPWPDGGDAFVYVPMAENTGGAGGFAEGVRQAYRLGAEWFWLMDDDVTVMPDAIGKLSKWAGPFDVVQGSRLDYDGGPFYWQYQFVEPLGMYNPLAPSGFDETGCKPTNTMCFEGGLFSRGIVEKLGPPDARFFIYWDDCVYGYLASKVGESAVVQDVILQRTRDIHHWEVSGVRQLNGSSNMTRRHVMRNRGHMAHYMQMHGDYNPLLFGLGTAACAAKEAIRLVAVDRGDLKEGALALFDGWREARRIMADESWKPVTPDDL